MAIRADFPAARSSKFRAERLFLTEKSHEPLSLRPGLRGLCSSYARRAGRCIGTSLILGSLIAGPCIFAGLPRTATAQTVERVVQGKVELASGGMAKGAIVYIKNGKTLEVRTYISTADGSYRFGQLNPDANYTVWAEYQGKKSKERTISSFDTKKIFNIVLKIDA